MDISQKRDASRSSRFEAEIGVPRFEPVTVDYSFRYAGELVSMWRASFEKALAIIDPHPIEEQLKYLEENVVPGNQVVVVLDGQTSAVIGSWRQRRTGFLTSTYMSIIRATA